MKKLLVLGSVLCGILVMASPAAAHNYSGKPSLTCDGIVTSVSVRDVNVPAGASCTLVDSIVRNDVKVRAGSYFQATDTDIGGSIWSRDSQTVFVEAGSGVGDTIQTRNTAQVFVFGSFIGDEIDVSGASDETQICGNRVRWDIEVTGSQQNILVGDPDAVDCAGNRVLKGDIEIERNNTDVELVVAGNRIAQGDLEVLRNTGTSEKRVSDNRGGDKIDCRFNEAPFVSLNNTQFNDSEGQCA